MKTVAFYTLGCKVNQYETEAMAELFTARGYETVAFESAADVYVVNTCTVTSISDRKSRQMIRRAKKINPDSVLAVTGCYAQTAPEEIKKIDGVNLILGTQERNKIVDAVEALQKEDMLCQVEDIMRQHTFEPMQVSGYESRTRAYIKIQEGCSQFCTYCIIPYARGPIRSRAPQEILEEISVLAEKGFSEIILTGIHVASYGLDRKDTSLAELLSQVNHIPGLRRIRMSSIEPMTLNETFIEQIKDCDKLCPHFHLSLQSGCDATLKRMNRKYTTIEYQGITDALRRHFKDVAITTDIMVGFPGETEEEFETTAKFVKQIRFADSHIFQYSPRKGTPAASYPDQIPPEVKASRSKIIEEITSRSRSVFLSSFQGRTVEVLFEQPCHDQPGWFEGKTANYITVRVPGQEDLSGQYHKVFIQEIKDGYAEGVLKK